MKAKKLCAALAICFVLAQGLFAQDEEEEGGFFAKEWTWQFSVMPALNVPMGVKNFEMGFSASAALECGFFPLPETVFPRNITAGVFVSGGFTSLGIKDGSTFQFFEGSAGPFADWRIMDRLSLGLYLDAGVYQYTWEDMSHSRLRMGVSASAGYYLTPMVQAFALVGYTRYGFAEVRPFNDFRAGAGIKISLGELLRPRTLLSGEKTAQKQVFPVSYAWYENNDVAEVSITNNEPNAVTDLTLSFYMERYMSEPTVFYSLPRLASGSSFTAPVTALFNEAMLDLTENTTANAVVYADYRSLGAKKQASFEAPMPVYHRNAMSWDDDRRAASFVSARDPAAVYFARYVEAAIRRELIADAEKPDTNIRFAAALALFEALTEYGVNYVVDPASSYVELSESGSALDSLNYPYQTLFYRAGDCDDLSILYCSLLETLGVPTAFITVPGHIYMAFDAGEVGSVADNPVWNARLIDYEGRRWAPVEITVPRLGFAAAWRIGAREWNNTAPEDRKIYPMADSWKIYPPVSVSGAADNLPVMPEESELRRRYAAELQKMREP